MEATDLGRLPMTEMEYRLKDYMLRSPKLQKEIFTAEELAAFLMKLVRDNRSSEAPYRWQEEWSTDPLSERHLGKIDRLEQELVLPGSDFAIHSLEDNIPDDVPVAVSRMIRYMPAHWHTNEYLEIYYVFSGSCPLLLDDETLWMQPGSLVLLAPFANHATPCYQDNCVLVSYLVRPEAFHISYGDRRPNLLSDFLYHALNDRSGDRYIRFELGEDEALRCILERIYYEYYGKEPYRAQLLTVLLHEMLLLLLRGHESEAILPSGSRIRWRNGHAELFGYMMNHYRDLTLDRLSQEFGYSKRQLIRLLRTCADQTFTGIIVGLKMDYAARLLREGRYSNGEIANLCGYQNLPAFQRAFLKHFSCTPVQYRRKHHEHEPSTSQASEI